MPDEYRPEIAKTGIKDAGALAKAYLSAQSALGASIRIPGKDAGAEDWERFSSKLASVPGLVRLPESDDDAGWQAVYEKLGTPNTPDGYKWEAEDEHTKELDRWLAAQAHEAKLTVKQATAMREKLMALGEQTQVKAQEQNAAALQAAEEALRGEWKNGFDQNMARAEMVLKRFGSESLINEVAEAGGLKVAPELAKMLHAIGASFEEDTLVRGMPQGLAPTESELRAQIGEIERNPAYLNRFDPLHDSLVQKRFALFEKLQSLKAA